MKNLILATLFLLPTFALADGEGCIKRNVTRQIDLSVFPGSSQDHVRETRFVNAARFVTHMGPMTSDELDQLRASAIRAFTQLAREHGYMNVTNAEVTYEASCEPSGITPRIFSCSVGEVSATGSYSYWDCPDLNQR